MNIDFKTYIIEIFLNFQYLGKMLYILKIKSKNLNFLFIKDMKNNALKHIQELTDELNNEKRRINDLIKEKNEKDMNIQILHTQLDSLQHQQQPTQLHPQQQHRADRRHALRVLMPDIFV